MFKKSGFEDTYKMSRNYAGDDVRHIARKISLPNRRPDKAIRTIEELETLIDSGVTELFRMSCFCNDILGAELLVAPFSIKSERTPILYYHHQHHNMRTYLCIHDANVGIDNGYNCRFLFTRKAMSMHVVFDGIDQGEEYCPPDGVLQNHYNNGDWVSFK